MIPDCYTILNHTVGELIWFSWFYFICLSFVQTSVHFGFAVVVGPIDWKPTTLLVKVLLFEFCGDPLFNPVDRFGILIVCDFWREESTCWTGGWTSSVKSEKKQCIIGQFILYRSCSTLLWGKFCHWYTGCPAFFVLFNETDISCNFLRLYTLVWN